MSPTPHNEVVPYDEQWQRHLRRLRRRRICWLGLLPGGRLCVYVFKILLWKLRGVQRNDCAGEEKGYKKIQVRK